MHSKKKRTQLLIGNGNFKCYSKTIDRSKNAEASDISMNYGQKRNRKSIFPQLHTAKIK